MKKILFGLLSFLLTTSLAANQNSEEKKREPTFFEVTKQDLQDGAGHTIKIVTHARFPRYLNLVPVVYLAARFADGHLRGNCEENILSCAASFGLFVAPHLSTVIKPEQSYELSIVNISSKMLYYGVSTFSALFFAGQAVAKYGFFSPPIAAAMTATNIFNIIYYGAGDIKNLWAWSQNNSKKS